jgi:hypothetical protein
MLLQLLQGAAVVVRVRHAPRLAVLDLPSARSFTAVCRDRGVDMTEASPTRQDNPAVQRLRRARLRRREGTRVIALELRDSEVAALV